MKYKTFKFSSLFIFMWVITFQVSFGQSKLTTDQFDSLLTTNKSVQLIDVRTPAEVASGHIKGAKNIDYNSPDFMQKINALDRSQPIAVYCAAGGRSGRTIPKLKEAGFTQVYDLLGGLTEWKAKQKPIETTVKK